MANRLSFRANVLGWSAARVRKSSISQNILQPAYSLAKAGFDAAETEPSKVWYKGVTRYYCNAWITYGLLFCVPIQIMRTS